MRREPQRVAGQRKDERVETGLDALNERLAGFGEEAGARVERPVFLIVGHQRSGSTLVSQYLSLALDVGYPSNLVARFWRAPVAGIRLQQALRHQIGPPGRSFTSELGTTHSLLEPHEFSYFWNHWFPAERRCRDREGFRRALAAMERAFEAPLLFKSILNSLRIGLLAEILPTAVFVRVDRNLLDVACSTLDARRRRYGHDRAWLGVVPEACEELSDRPAAEQIAAQVTMVERSLREGLAALPQDRVVEVGYEDFCREPAALAGRLRVRGVPARQEVSLPASFEARSAARDHPDAPALASALRAADPNLTRRVD